jgi:hypothetical protein
MAQVADGLACMNNYECISGICGFSQTGTRVCQSAQNTSVCTGR